MTTARSTALAPDARGGRFEPAVLRAFGEVARVRFGLARMERSPVGLARRLSLALTDARVEPPDAERFVSALAQETDTSPWVRAAADAITNRETWFFRDRGQLQAAVAEAGRTALSRGEAGLRVLCAGCATGEEPLSVAMLALDAPHLFWAASVEVTGFDLSPRAIAQARSGQFRSAEVRRAEEGPGDWTSRFFRSQGDALVARKWLTDRVRFEVMNLLCAEPALPPGRFDLVLCRNVLIYFDEPATTRALASLARWVRPGGLLVLGTAEAGLGEAPQLLRTPIPGVFRREASA